MNTVAQINHNVEIPDEALNRQIIEDLVDAFARHDVEAMMVNFADHSCYEDMTGASSNGKVSRGKDAIRKTFARQIKLLPAHTFEDAIIIVSGDRAHANWTLVVGSQREKQYRVRGCDYFELEQGKITLKSAWMKNHNGLRWAIVKSKLREIFLSA